MREFYNMDCMEGMKQFPNKFFDLAIVDPPYGAGFTENGGCKGWFTKYHQDTEKDKNIGTHFHGRGRSKRYVERYNSDDDGISNSDRKKKVIGWDTAPPPEYFDELFRVSKNQIIWGGNYFSLPPTRCFLVWKKHIPENFTMAMCEYAWTSFNANAKVFEKASQDPNRFHPTQKPVALYSWILSNYAKDGDIILDTHVGSGSSLVACEKMGFQYVGYEIDETYYKKAKERIETERAQLNLFRAEDALEQQIEFEGV